MKKLIGGLIAAIVMGLLGLFGFRTYKKKSSRNQMTKRVSAIRESIDETNQRVEKMRAESEENVDPLEMDVKID